MIFMIDAFDDIQRYIAKKRAYVQDGAPHVAALQAGEALGGAGGPVFACTYIYTCIV